ncbi:MAG: PadR family transcriptional regulator [Coriobacteriia bacterium]
MNAPHHSAEPCGHGNHGDSGRTGFKHPFGLTGHPHGFGGPGGQRVRRGDVRTAILRLLAEQPMHGYQIIQELSSRSDGAWTPSAGSVYPTLQQLADEGLVSADESAGKKVFSLTESGVAAAAACADEPAPWEAAAQGNSDSADFREAAAKLMQAGFQIGKGGTAAQVAAAVEVLNDARKKLYTILAEG